MRSIIIDATIAGTIIVINTTCYTTCSKHLYWLHLANICLGLNI